MAEVTKQKKIKYPPKASTGDGQMVFILSSEETIQTNNDDDNLESTTTTKNNYTKMKSIKTYDLLLRHDNTPISSRKFTTPLKMSKLKEILELFYLGVKYTDAKDGVYFSAINAILNNIFQLLDQASTSEWHAVNGSRFIALHVLYNVNIMDIIKHENAPLFDAFPNIVDEFNKQIENLIKYDLDSDKPIDMADALNKIHVLLKRHITRYLSKENINNINSTTNKGADNRFTAIVNMLFDRLQRTKNVRAVLCIPSASAETKSFTKPIYKLLLSKRKRLSALIDAFRSGGNAAHKLELLANALKKKEKNDDDKANSSVLFSILGSSTSLPNMQLPPNVNETAACMALYVKLIKMLTSTHSEKYFPPEIIHENSIESNVKLNMSLKRDEYLKYLISDYLDMAVIRFFTESNYAASLLNKRWLLNIVNLEVLPSNDIMVELLVDNKLKMSEKCKIPNDFKGAFNDNARGCDNEKWKVLSIDNNFDTVREVGNFNGVTFSCINVYLRRILRDNFN